MRRDLSIGLIGANLIHAAGESVTSTLPEHVHAVALTCPDEAALRAVWAKLKANKVGHRAIVECDGPHAGQLMAIGCHPAKKKEIHKLLSSLPLLK